MSAALGLALFALAVPAGAKEAHFEKVKFELLQLYVRCTTCHEHERGSGLTKYGQRLADMGAGTSVQERMRRMERRVSQVLAQTEPQAENDRVDIDGDGALNWVEILCGTDPSDTHSTPVAKSPEAQAPPLRARVETVVDCRLCHTSVETVGGEDKAPHNAFGESIAKLDVPPPAARPGSGGARQVPPKREPSEFLPRFQKVANQDVDRDKVRNWDEIAAFHSPTDKTDTPTPEELKAIKERILAVRRGDAGFAKAHRE